MIKSKIFTDGFCLETDEIKLRPSKMEDLEAFLSISSPPIWTHMSQDLENPSDWEKFLSQTISDRENQINDRASQYKTKTN